MPARNIYLSYLLFSNLDTGVVQMNFMILRKKLSQIILKMLYLRIFNNVVLTYFECSASHSNEF